MENGGIGRRCRWTTFIYVLLGLWVRAGKCWASRQAAARSFVQAARHQRALIQREGATRRSRSSLTREAARNHVSLEQLQRLQAAIPTHSPTTLSYRNKRVLLAPLGP